MQAIIDAFEAAVATSVSVSNRIHVLDQSGGYEFSEKERELVTQASFVRMFVAFEEFLEASFGYYGMGGASLQGNPAVCYANAPGLDHMHLMFIGMMRYMDWSSPDRVRELADLYFEGGQPFGTPLASAHGTLLDMKTVRNAASHVSRTTSAQVEALYGRWTSAPRQGATAYDILTASQGGSGSSFMGESEAVLRSLVTQIANY